MKIRNQGHIESRRERGFTLVEVILSLSIISLLSLSIVMIMSSITSVTTSMVISQRESVKLGDFEEYIEGVWGGGSTSSILSLESSGEQALQEMRIAQTVVYFPRAGKDVLAEEVVFRSVFNKNGLLDLEVEYIARKDAEEEVVVKVVILENLEMLEWLFYDERSRGWVSEWPAMDRKPILGKLIYKLSGVPYSRVVLLAK